MKQLKHFCAVTLLVLTLGIPAYAGDMDTPAVVPPPPPPPSSAPAPADIGMPGFATPAPGEMDAPTLEAMAIEAILGALALY